MMSVQCIQCKHYLGLIQCDAFPKRIPEEIFNGEFDHTEPHPNDNGIQFEKVDEQAL